MADAHGHARRARQRSPLHSGHDRHQHVAQPVADQHLDDEHAQAHPNDHRPVLNVSGHKVVDSGAVRTDVDRFVDALERNWQREACARLFDDIRATPGLGEQLTWGQPYFDHDGAAVTRRRS